MVGNPTVGFPPLEVPELVFAFLEGVGAIFLRTPR